MKENYELNSSTLAKIKKEYNINDDDYLYEMIGEGRLTAFTVLKKVYPKIGQSLILTAQL